MVKSNKFVFFIMLFLAVISLAATLVLLFVPEPQPITITEKFYLTEVQGGLELRGKIRNDSGQDRTFMDNGQQITVTVHINDVFTGTEYDRDYKIFYESVTVKAGESYEIRQTIAYNGETQITKVTAHLFKENYSMNYTLYGKVINDGTFAIIAAFVGFAGFVFLVAAISSLIGNIIIAKRANAIINEISQKCGGGIYAAGYYGDKKQERADATKTAFSFIGAAISAFFLGIGFYRTHLGRLRRDFVICDNALFEVYGKKREYFDITPNVRDNFKNAKIVEKRNLLTMTGADGKSYLTFTARKGEKQKLYDALNNLFQG